MRTGRLGRGGGRCCSAAIPPPDRAQKSSCRSRTRTSQRQTRSRCSVRLLKSWLVRSQSLSWPGDSRHKVHARGETMKKAVLCGAGGFIASHLVKRLKKEGFWVRGVDLKRPEFGPTAADDFQVVDLRDPKACAEALILKSDKFDTVYQLAADMGGMGFIHSAECEIMRNSALVNINMIHAAAQAGIKRYFFSSSVCIYRDMQAGEPELTEAQAYPALPDNEYGWEKLYAERMAMAFGRKYGIDVRIARFQNCYGPEGTWTGGREKAPAAICRKVAE